MRSLFICLILSASCFSADGEAALPAPSGLDLNRMLPVLLIHNAIPCEKVNDTLRLCPTGQEVYTEGLPVVPLSLPYWAVRPISQAQQARLNSFQKDYLANLRVACRSWYDIHKDVLEKYKVKCVKEKENKTLTAARDKAYSSGGMPGPSAIKTWNEKLQFSWDALRKAQKDLAEAQQKCSQDQQVPLQELVKSWAPMVQRYRLYPNFPPESEANPHNVLFDVIKEQ